MRLSILIIIAGMLSACTHGEPSKVTLNLEKPTRVNDCNVFLDEALLQDPLVAYLTYACDVPESALNEKNWWGEGSKRPWTGMYVGDCLRLGNRFYCMETIKPGESVTLKATYEITHRRGDHLRPIR
ncbi:hypothetical protein [Polyangium mundeleinium]|uniref:Lipoprotein n=1 Tax=Polyangium mundeleinium TaxID=2995306 RepID=A0ABT5ELC7_9BACT|nr:hypothetical protein [Polyangium mundeleinium]MDC0742566.1 hypothetical protein [Polyangium mundeleinium]